MLDFFYDMMASSNGNIFRVTGPLWGEFTGEFPSQRPVTRSYDVFFYQRPNKWLSKPSRRRWFETPSCSLWHHCNERSLILGHGQARSTHSFLWDVIQHHYLIYGLANFLVKWCPVWWMRWYMPQFEIYIYIYIRYYQGEYNLDFQP